MPKLSMIKGGVGGARTLTGLRFEKRIDLKKAFLKLKGYSVVGEQVLFDTELVAELYKKHSFYKKFLEPRKVKWSELLSKKLLPDQVAFVVKKNTVFIIEIKFQKVAGSVDEKLQTCAFKKKQYEKLVGSLGFELEYVYVLNKWFKQACYKDTLAYVTECDCHYFFKEVPLSFLGLPAGS